MTNMCVYCRNPKGCLKPGDIGEIVAVGPVGSILPFKVRVEFDASVTHVTKTSRVHLAL
jgi:hypothetical protein